MRTTAVAVLAVLASVVLVSQAGGVTPAAFSCMFPRVPASKVHDWNGELNSGTCTLERIFSNGHSEVLTLIPRRDEEGKPIPQGDLELKNCYFNPLCWEDAGPEPILNVLNTYGINTWHRVVMFMAQTGQETDHYNTFTEYTNSGGTNAWCKNYDGGCKYLGRGAIQLTGKHNYNAAGNHLGQDFVNHPTLVAQKQWAFKTAGWFWKTHNLNKCSDAGDVTACTRTINGGTNGLAARVALYETAKRCIPKAGITQTLGFPPVRLPPVHTPCFPKAYVVQPGDTLSSIAKAFRTTASAIKKLNHIKEIYVGQKLKIPC